MKRNQTCRPECSLLIPCSWVATVASEGFHFPATYSHQTAWEARKARHTPKTVIWRYRGSSAHGASYRALRAFLR